MVLGILAVIGILLVTAAVMDLRSRRRGLHYGDPPQPNPLTRAEFEMRTRSQEDFGKGYSTGN